MVRIRLIRVGSKRQPSYRIVTMDRESPRDGRFLESVGFYNPRTQPATITLEEEKIYTWLKNGAQPTDSVKQLFLTSGLSARYERFKSGEAVETLLTEAEAAAKARNISAKTRSI